MRALFIIVTMLTTLTVGAVSPKPSLKSDARLKECSSLVMNRAMKLDVSGKDMLKALNQGIKECRMMVRDDQKKEREISKRLKLEQQIAKLQAKLGK